jgi:hypothetical protein
LSEQSFVLGQPKLFRGFQTKTVSPLFESSLRSKLGLAYKNSSIVVRAKFRARSTKLFRGFQTKTVSYLVDKILPVVVRSKPSMLCRPNSSMLGKPKLFHSFQTKTVL